MRPDKKKKHHPKQQQEKATGTEEATKPRTRRPVRTKTDEGESSSPLDPKYASRNVSNNWTKYEIPSADDDSDQENAMTGEDFNEVLQRAGGSDTLLRLKAEREWEEAVQDQVASNKYFSLDLKAIAKDMATIPVHHQIGLADSDLEIATLEALLEQTETSAQKLMVSADQVNSNLMEKLKLRTSNQDDGGTAAEDSNNDSSSSAKKKESKDEEVSNLEEWLDDFLEDS